MRPVVKAGSVAQTHQRARVSPISPDRDMKVFGGADKQTKCAGTSCLF
jgi:hypothetical protein